ncbi:MAG: terminase large subunit domain-containing protein [Casimicrobium sp.]
MTPRMYALRPHPVHIALMRSTARFRVVPAGRRSGKTERAKRFLVSKACAAIDDGCTDARFFAAAPTRDQAKAIYWHDLKAMIPPMLLASRPSETSLTIQLVTGAEICVVGMDKPERIEGRPWDGGILDEFANMKARAWSENVRPALSDRKGWCWLIGVPEGRNHYYDLWKRAISGEDPEWEGFTWKSAEILDADEIASARRDLDPLVFEQEYEASFVNFSGRAYYNFNESRNCARLSYDPRGAIAFCFDFNVEPGVAAVVQEQRLPNGQDGTGAIGQVHIPVNSTTPAVCRRLAQDWKDHQGLVKLYGDATGGARGTAKVAGSDWDIIKAELRPVFGDRLRVCVPEANPTERARVNAMNTRMLSADGVVRFMVDPAKAPHLVKDLEGVRTLDGGSGEIDKKADPKLTHISDAVGYYVEKEFPIVRRTATQTSLRIA